MNVTFASDWQSTRDRVLSRYSTVYAFCDDHPELKRSTVYQVLSGRYSGRIDVQIRKILAALDITPPSLDQACNPELSQEETIDALQTIKCSHCRLLDRRGCSACHTRTEREARELYLRLFPGGKHEDADSGHCDADK